jgi:hypothetical protein
MKTRTVSVKDVTLSMCVSFPKLNAETIAQMVVEHLCEDDETGAYPEATVYYEAVRYAAHAIRHR